MEFVENVTARLIQSNASDNMTAMAAWVSNDADSEERLQDEKRKAGLINFLYRNRHMSPFEHGSLTWKVDVPLFVAREYHRHRTWSYNEVSGRYTVMQPRFYRGTTARVQKGKMGNYYFEDADENITARYFKSKERSVKVAWEEYMYRLDLGMAKEQAREDLPLSLMTQFYATANPRNVMAFLTLRNDSHALREIRDVAVQIEADFARQMPLTYAAYKSTRDSDFALSEAARLVDGNGQTVLDLLEDYWKKEEEVYTS